MQPPRKSFLRGISAFLTMQFLRPTYSTQIPQSYFFYTKNVETLIPRIIVQFFLSSFWILHMYFCIFWFKNTLLLTINLTHYSVIRSSLTIKLFSGILRQPSQISNSDKSKNKATCTSLNFSNILNVFTWTYYFLLKIQTQILYNI